MVSQQSYSASTPQIDTTIGTSDSSPESDMSKFEKANGAGFIGYTLCLSLYGTTIAQSIFFFLTAGERKATKILVSFLCMLETFHIYLLGTMFWDLATKNRVYGNEQKLVWQQVTQFGIAYIISFFVQWVWLVSKNVIVTSVIAIASVIQLGGGMAFTANVVRNRSARGFFNEEGHKTALIELIGSMACDLTISGSLAYCFHSFRIGKTRTDTILQELIVISVNMGVLLCIVTAVNIILFNMENGASPSLAPHVILSKLYVNSLLATLNTRRHFRDIVSRTVSTPMFDLPPSEVDHQCNVEA